MVLSMIFFQPLGGRSVGWLSIFEGLRDFACLLAGLSWVGFSFCKMHQGIDFAKFISGFCREIPPTPILR
jgi:hypothetical protein